MLRKQETLLQRKSKGMLQMSVQTQMFTKSRKEVQWWRIEQSVMFGQGVVDIWGLQIVLTMGKSQSLKIVKLSLQSETQSLNSIISNKIQW